jgi:hypothetical protein
MTPAGPEGTDPLRVGVDVLTDRPGSRILQYRFAKPIRHFGASERGPGVALELFISSHARRRCGARRRRKVEQNYTLPLGLVSLQGNLGTGSVATVLAGVVLSMIPAVLVFVFGQRRLREGLTAGIGK